MDNPQETLTVEERAWLGAMLDGEGYIGLTNAGRVRHNKPHFRGAICIANTDSDIVWEVVRILRKMGVNPYIQNKAKAVGQRPAMLVWVKNLMGVAIVLLWTTKYIRGSKRLIAQLTYDFVQSRIGKTNEEYTAAEMELISKVSILNKRGSSTTTRDALLRSLNGEMKI